MIRLYGTAQSRARRSLWALEELGLKYEHFPVGFDGATRKPDYLRINPNGHVPALDDDGFIIWESMAINLYLAEEHGKSPFWPSSVHGHGSCYQWSFFGMTEIETSMLAIFMNRILLPAEERDEQVALKAVETLNAPMKVLDDHLHKSEYLLGNDFTIADLNVASVMSFADFIQFDFSPTPTVQKWLQKCLKRPAQAKVGSMK